MVVHFLFQALSILKFTGSFIFIMSFFFIVCCTRMIQSGQVTALVYKGKLCLRERRRLFLALTADQRQLPVSALCVLNRFSHIQLFVIPWTIVHQVPLSMGFSSQEYWSRMPFPSAGDLPNPGIQPRLLFPLLWETDFLLVVPLENPYLRYGTSKTGLEVCTAEWKTFTSIFHHLYITDVFTFEH